MKQITRDWLEAAALDIERIGYLLQNERLTVHVAFLSQQAIEKSFLTTYHEIVHSQLETSVPLINFHAFQPLPHF